MSPPGERFRALALQRFPVSDLVVREQDDPFAVTVECDFEGIGRISVEPLSDGHLGTGVYRAVVRRGRATARPASHRRGRLCAR